MFPVHTILHPTDFSNRSRYALHMACALARDYGARLVVFHVIPAPSALYGEGAVFIDWEESLTAAREHLDALELPDESLHVERRLEEGDAGEAILRMAENVGADLIVMGTHGKSGLERLLMGSVADQVVRKAECPVLTVKTPSREMMSERKLSEAATPAGAGI